MGHNPAHRGLPLVVGDSANGRIMATCHQDQMSGNESGVLGKATGKRTLEPTMKMSCGSGGVSREGGGILGSPGKDTKEEQGSTGTGSGQPGEVLALQTASWLLGPGQRKTAKRGG